MHAKDSFYVMDTVLILGQTSRCSVITELCAAILRHVEHYSLKAVCAAAVCMAVPAVHW